MGTPLLESVSWFLVFLEGFDFLVSKFLSFKVSRFQSSLAVWFQSFKASKIHSMFSTKDIGSILPDVHCVQEDIDPILKISKQSEDGSS